MSQRKSFQIVIRNSSETPRPEFIITTLGVNPFKEIRDCYFDGTGGWSVDDYYFTYGSSTLDLEKSPKEQGMGYYKQEYVYFHEK